MPRKKKTEPEMEPHRNSLEASVELRGFIDEIRDIRSDKAALAEREKELFAEAKGRGYDTKIMRRVISDLNRNPDEIAEEEAILTLYREALNLYIGAASEADTSFDGESEEDPSGLV